MTASSELSEREIEILRLVATGASNKEIAQSLYISANTVKVHVRNIFAKIGAASRTEAALYALNNGLVPLGTPMPAPLEAVVEPGEAQESPADESTLPAMPVLEPGPAPGLVEILPLTPSVRLGLPRRLLWLSVALGTALLVAVLALAAAWARQPVTPPGRETTRLALPLVSQPTTLTETARWQVLAPMPAARLDLALAAVEERLYAIGGDTGQGPTGLVERFDPTLGSWEQRASKPVAVDQVGAVVIGGKVYVPGGRLASGQISDRLEIYNPRLDQWSQGAPLPAPRCAYALAAFEGRLYLFGGWDGRQFVAAVYAYDPQSDRWQVRRALPSPRGLAGAAALQGRIFVVGGYDGSRALDAVLVYQPDRDESGGSPWSNAAPLPSGGRYAMGVVSLADILHVIGGEGGAPGLPALAFQPLANQWQTFNAPPPADWSHLGLAALGSRLYAVGGKQAQQPSAQTLSYQAIYTLSFPVIR